MASAELRRPAYAAAVLAFTSAAVSLFWTLGGTFLLDTVGGAIEDTARERSAGAIALGGVTVALKVTAGLLAVALVRPWGTRIIGRRALVGASVFGSLVLVLWGGANVVVGGLALGDVVVSTEPVDEHALRWHVFFWDPWFVIWGAALALAAVRYRRS